VGASEPNSELIKMDKVVKYKFAMGRLNEIKNKKLKVSEINGNYLDELKKFFRIRKSGVIVPKFAGIYQTEELVLNNQEERKYKESIEKSTRFLKEQIDFFGRNLIENYVEERDNLYPDLISVCYNGELFNVGMVRKYFEDDLGRVRFLAWQEVPNFYHKDTNLIGAFLETIKKLKSFRERKKLVSSFTYEFINELSEQRVKYGLTTEEFAFLKLMESNKPKKIIVPPADSKLISY